MGFDPSIWANVTKSPGATPFADAVDPGSMNPAPGLGYGQRVDPSTFPDTGGRPPWLPPGLSPVPPGQGMPPSPRSGGLGGQQGQGQGRQGQFLQQLLQMLMGSSGASVPNTGQPGSTMAQGGGGQQPSQDQLQQFYRAIMQLLGGQGSGTQGGSSGV